VLGLSLVLAVWPLVQPATAQTVTPIQKQPVTIQGTPFPEYTVRPSVTPPPGVQVVSCGGQARIFQNCPIDGATEIRLENQAIDAVLALHQLPASDRNRVLAWARDEVRATLFANLVGAYKKPADQRSADEATALAGLTRAVRQKRGQAAGVAIDQYNRWNQNPCLYTPPMGFSYERGTACGSSAFQLFGRPNPPSLADLQAYGAASAYADYDSDASLRALSGDTAKALGTMSGLASVGVAAAVGANVGANLTVGTLAVVQPFAAVAAAKAAGVATATASGTAAGVSGAISVGAVLAIVVLAIVIAVVQGVNVFTAADLPRKLQSDLSDAQSYDPSSALGSYNGDTSKATQELYAAFLTLTKPDYPGGQVPAPESTDTPLLIGGVPTWSIQYLAWDNSRHSARLSGGWWVDTAAAGQARLTLTIDYLNPNGQALTAGRTGSQFLSTGPGQPSASGATPALSNMLTYRNWQGTPETATLPSAAARGPALVAKGPYVRVDPSNWTLAPQASTTFQVDASAGTCTNASPCPDPLANWTVDITYDPAVVQVARCTLVAPGSCNKKFGANTIRIEGGTDRLRSGPQTLAHLTFTAVGARGAVSTLAVAVPRLNDTRGAPVAPVLSPGQISIG
jgi:hypothetical protein